MVNKKLPTIENFRKIPGTKVYRSSRPGTPSSTLLFKQENIKTVIDLTTDSGDGVNTCLDSIYKPFKIEKASGVGDVPYLVSVSDPMVNPEELPEENRCYRVLVPMCAMRRMVATSPWYIRLLIILCSLIDQVFGTNTALNAVAWTIWKPLGKRMHLLTTKTILTEHGADMMSILQLLSLPEYVPAVIICGLGKDRTGIVSAIIGHICGKTKEDLIEDYTRSEKELPTNKKEFLIMDQLGVDPIAKQAPPETIHDLFDFVNKRYGSMDAYLESIGFGQEDQEKLRRNILAK